MYPRTENTEYFGGMDMSIWTCPASKWPSDILLSRYLANLCGTAPKFTRISLNIFFFLYLGIHTA